MEVSPYRAAKICSERFGREIRPQMIYNYVSKGYIPSHKNEEGKIQVTLEDLETWMEKFYQKNIQPQDQEV